MRAGKNMLKRLFTEHPATVGETYFEHLGSALSFAFDLLAAGAACLIHAFLPFLFLKTGSRKITQLYDRMVTNRSRLRQTADLPNAGTIDWAI
jgi:hypothetical protein